MLCASCSERLALRKFLCASCSAQVLCASCAAQVVQVVLRKLCSASCSVQVALRKLLCAICSVCASCSAQGALRKCFLQVLCMRRASCFAQVALRKLLCVSCSAQIALRKLLCASCSAQVAPCKLLCASCSERLALCKRFLCASAPCKLLCASCSVQVALCKLLCASCSVQVLCVSAPCKLRWCKLLCASCSERLALRKFLCASCSVQVALRKSSVQVAPCNLRYASCCSAQVALRKLPCASQPELRERSPRASFVLKNHVSSRSRRAAVDEAGIEPATARLREQPRQPPDNFQEPVRKQRNSHGTTARAIRHARSPQRVHRAPPEFARDHSQSDPTRTIPQRAHRCAAEFARDHRERERYDTHDPRRGSPRAARISHGTTARAIRHARSPQRVAGAPQRFARDHSESDPTRTIPAEGSPRVTKIQRERSDTHDLRRGSHCRSATTIPPPAKKENSYTELFLFLSFAGVKCLT